MSTKPLTKVINKPAFAQIAENLVNRNPFVLNGRLIYPHNGKIGRPSVMTTEVVRKLEYAFTYDCSIEEGCLYAGIARNTYYEFVKQYPDFQDRISELRTISKLMARVTLINAAMEDATLALKYLERKYPAEFGL